MTPDRWKAVLSALRDSGDRFAELATSCDPAVPATRHWTVADTVAHVTSIASWDTALVHPDDLGYPYPWDVLHDLLRDTTVDTVNVLNDNTLQRFTERDPRLLAKQLRDHIDEIVGRCRGLDPDRPINWLGGAPVPMAGIIAHLTNEIQIHGRDIARAVRAPWLMSPAYAAQFLELFVIGVARLGIGQLLHKTTSANQRRIAVEFRSRHTDPATLVSQRDGLTLGEPGAPADVRIRFDPVTLNLMLFGRTSRLRAALTGGVFVGGPRPWLLPAFLRTLRLPA